MVGTTSNLGLEMEGFDQNPFIALRQGEFVVHASSVVCQLENRSYQYYLSVTSNSDSHITGRVPWDVLVDCKYYWTSDLA